MPEVGFPSFDQLNVFSTVAESGSFSAAARRLGLVGEPDLSLATANPPHAAI